MTAMHSKFKNIFQCFIALLGAFMASHTAFAGGLIVNEISNGPAGSQEFYELMVVGDAGSPAGAINLNGWIIDDNNGDWQGSSTGIGISGGYVRINTALNPGSCAGLNSVMPGSILVIYNPADVNPNVPVADFSDANGDGVYVFAAGSACIERCRPTPNNSNPAYSACVPHATQDFTSLQLRNGGDVGQVRNPAATFIHGFAYGDTSPPYPAGSFRVSPLSGRQSTFVFLCGDWSDAANFARQSHTTETPGAANGVTNAIFRQKVTNGTLNYSNLADPSNCSIDPDINITKTSVIDTDPINISTNPKAIPGSEAIYSIMVENEGFGTPDANTIAIIDDLPAEVTLFIGNFSGGSPVVFLDGPVSSNLAVLFTSLASTTDNIDFSNDGGVSYNYVPSPDTDGYDGNITHLRITPTGTFAASDGTDHPSFMLQFKIKLD